MERTKAYGQIREESPHRVTYAYVYYKLQDKVTRNLRISSDFGQINDNERCLGRDLKDSGYGFGFGTAAAA